MGRTQGACGIAHQSDQHWNLNPFESQQVGVMTMGSLCPPTGDTTGIKIPTSVRGMHVCGTEAQTVLGRECEPRGTELLRLGQRENLFILPQVWAHERGRLNKQLCCISFVSCRCEGVANKGSTDARKNSQNTPKRSALVRAFE